MLERLGCARIATPRGPAADTSLLPELDVLALGRFHLEALPSLDISSV